MCEHMQTSYMYTVHSAGNFCWPTGKKEGRKEGNMEKKRRKIWNVRGESMKLTKGPFSFFFFFFLSFLFTFWIQWNLFWVYQNGNYRERAFHARKKIGNSDFAPSEKYSSYPTEYTVHHGLTSIITINTKQFCACPHHLDKRMLPR